MSIKYIKGFDALRAISILFVLQAHLGTFHLLPNSTFLREGVWHLISGSTGVNIFFVLSGFLITRILLNERREYGTINLRNFYIRRLLRLTPPVIILLLVLFSLMITGLIKESYLGLAMASTYTFNYAPLHDMTPELGHMWSLSVEEQYYFLWPIALLAIKKHKTILALSAILIFVCILYMQYIGHIPIIDTHSISIKGYNIILGKFFNTRHWLIPAIGPILIGSSISMLIHYNQERANKLFSTNKLITPIALLLFLSPLFLPLSIAGFFAPTQSLGVALFLTWILFNQTNAICNILELPLLRYIGRISYGLYVYHGLFVRTGPEGATLTIQQFPINIILTFITAILSYELMEQKVLRYKQQFK
ncbi:MAG: acyltransferase [Flavipsychrobacter sp.]